MERPWSVENLIEFIVDSARRGRADSTPFHHLQFDRVFPDDIYSAMLQAMPASEDYRAMSGKTKIASSRPDWKPTRAKIDLFPEYLRHLSSEKRAIWDVVGQALRSKELGRVFMERLAPGLQRRFGANFSRTLAKFAPNRRCSPRAAAPSPDLDPRHPRLSRYPTQPQFVE